MPYPNRSRLEEVERRAALVRRLGGEPRVGSPERRRVETDSPGGSSPDSRVSRNTDELIAEEYPDYVGRNAVPRPDTSHLTVPLPQAPFEAAGNFNNYRPPSYVASQAELPSPRPERPSQAVFSTLGNFNNHHGDLPGYAGSQALVRSPRTETGSRQRTYPAGHPHGSFVTGPPNMDAHAYPQSGVNFYRGQFPVYEGLSGRTGGTHNLRGAIEFVQNPILNEPDGPNPKRTSPLCGWDMTKKYDEDEGLDQQTLKDACGQPLTTPPCDSVTYIFKSVPGEPGRVLAPNSRYELTVGYLLRDIHRFLHDETVLFYNQIRRPLDLLDYSRMIYFHHANIYIDRRVAIGGEHRHICNIFTTSSPALDRQGTRVT